MGSVKPIVTVLSMLLVVGIAIGLITGVRNVNHPNTSDDESLASASKAVRAFCSPTNYKKACVDSLRGLSRNNSATPKDYLQLAISAAVEAINGSIDKTEYLYKVAPTQEQKDAFEDCKTLLRFANYELEKTSSNIQKIDINAMNEKVIVLKSWLSATISYQQSCVSIIEPPLMDEMCHNLLNATQLTCNVLAMVSDSKTIFKNMGSEEAGEDPDQKPLRRLLGTIDDRYPGWLSASDRKLLEVKNIGAVGNPNAVVAQDGSGKYKTIGAALASYPKGYKGRYIIYVKAGLYKEKVTVDKDMKDILMYGDGPRKTIVTGRLNYAEGTNTWRSATFAAIGNGFICRSMGFQNTAGPKGHQAVALRVQSDKSVFYNCRIDGFQDSLYAQAHRQFYRNCVISGTVDIIFGDSATLIQNSLIIVRRPMDGQKNTVTAQGKFDGRETTGIVIQNCRIVPDQELFPDRFKIGSYLGRPWKQYSTTVIMESTLADFVHPAGWLPWTGTFALNTLFYAEYANRGPGAVTVHRVTWKGYRVITDREEAAKWTIVPFLQGRDWIANSSTPHIIGLRS